MTRLQMAARRQAEEVWILMRDIGVLTSDGIGITRAAFGPGEQVAAEQVAQFARRKRLDVQADRFGNLHVTVPGEHPERAAVAAGSHLDSVPRGGNYDGLAGVVGALAVLAAAREEGIRLPRPLRAIAMRGEESPWFGTAYVGSRLMLGRSTIQEIGGLAHSVSGRTLSDHLAELGTSDERASGPVVSPADLACFLELHIEQGPLLESEGLPLGIASAIRGNVRFPEARCFGEYAHSAAVPRSHRRDAVVALSELVLEFDRFWAGLIERGDDNFVVTIGKVSTDPEHHAMTKVPGEVRFSVNFGATSGASLDAARAILEGAVRDISQRLGVRFDLGREFGTAPVALDPGLIRIVEQSAEAAAVPFRRMSTVGHDAAMFALSGIPAAVLLMRNAHGSHNPRETMAQDDFAAGVVVLAGAMERAAQQAVG
jgi:N-carbamoyl-L-amino-acid hydrolase